MMEGEKHVAGNNGHSAGKMILVVDDDEAVRLLARRALEHGGLRAVLAASGREAVDLYLAADGDIAVVLMDMTMPGMDGVETFRALKATDPGVRVVVSSGYGEEETVARFGDERPAGFIQKPYRISDLLAKVDATLRGETEEPQG